MKLKALCTIIGAKDARAVAGSEFDTKDLGIDTAEAESLIARGFAAEVVAEKKASKKAAEPAEPAGGESAAD